LFQELGQAGVVQAEMLFISFCGIIAFLLDFAAK
tara:strand:+ start:713 stop:814 length:102 start_codon:yes stop_codon:yes gene_type:complete